MKYSFILTGLISLFTVGFTAEARTVDRNELNAPNRELGHATRDAVTETNYTATRHHRHHRRHRRHR